jgi:hypothetical protein
MNSDTIVDGVSDPDSYRPPDELYEQSQRFFPLFMGTGISQHHQEGIYKVCRKIVDDIGISGMLGKIVLAEKISGNVVQRVIGGTGRPHSARTTIAVINAPREKHWPVIVWDDSGNLVCGIRIRENTIDLDSGDIYVVATDTGLLSWGGASNVYNLSIYNESLDKLDDSLIKDILLTLGFNRDKIRKGYLEEGSYFLLYVDDTGKFFTPKQVDPKNVVPVEDMTVIDYDLGYVTCEFDHLTTFGFQPKLRPGEGVYLGEPKSLGSGCFIATAAYGSSLEPKVKILREFRDRYLISNIIGMEFVNLYYTYSPPIAEIIARHDALRALVRVGLLPFVGISYSILHFGLLLTLVVILLFMVTAFYFHPTRSFMDFVSKYIQSIFGKTISHLR